MPCSSYLQGFFYFMTETKFYCENNNSELNIFEFDNYVEISIGNQNGGFNFIHLTINDTEKLMDELHKIIIQIEGGKQ